MGFSNLKETFLSVFSRKAVSCLLKQRNYVGERWQVSGLIAPKLDHNCTILEAIVDVEVVWHNKCRYVHSSSQSKLIGRHFTASHCCHQQDRREGREVNTTYRDQRTRNISRPVEKVGLYKSWWLPAEASKRWLTIYDKCDRMILCPHLNKTSDVALPIKTFSREARRILWLVDPTLTLRWVGQTADQFEVIH